MKVLTQLRGPLGGFAVAVGVAGGAVAYWTGGGSGGGSAPVASGPSGLVVRHATSLLPMYPGDAAQTISGNFDNPNTGPVYVGTVTARIVSVVKGTGAPAGTCDASDYVLANAAMPVYAEVPPGTASGSWSGATIRFNDKPATNQDACQGATVNLAYTVS